MGRQHLRAGAQYGQGEIRVHPEIKPGQQNPRKDLPRDCKSYGGTVGLDHFRGLTEMI